VSRNDQLRTLPLFRDCTDADLDVLGHAFVPERHPAEHIFIREGERADTANTAMYVIVEGNVSVTRAAHRGQPGLDRELGPGAAFGFMSLLDDAPRSATVIALTDVSVLSLTRYTFRELYHSNLVVGARFQLALARQLVRDLRALDDRLHRAVSAADCGPILGLDAEP
jgi:CRP-like cAMP-binding protein